MGTGEPRAGGELVLIREGTGLVVIVVVIIVIIILSLHPLQTNIFVKFHEIKLLEK